MRGIKLLNNNAWDLEETIYANDDRSSAFFVFFAAISIGKVKAEKEEKENERHY